MAPVAVVTCPALTIEHGLGNVSESLVNETAIVRCDLGYEINQQSAVVVNCSDTGQWSIQFPSCNRKYLIIL